MDRPPEELSTGAVSLRRWRADDAELCFRLVTESKDHLLPWMPWAAGYDVATATEYLRGCEAGWQSGEQFNYLVLVDGQAAGSAGLMARIGPGGLEIGYWVHPGYVNRGVATAAAGALTEAAFALPGVHRVEIIHDVNNVASERVPVKLGFGHVGMQESRFNLAPADSGSSKVWRITR
jgi:ribosomal-protein-serine acetyltransferase